MTSSLISEALPASSKPESRSERGRQLGNLLGLFLLFAVTTVFHSMRGFWYDELFTFHMTQQPSVWKALVGGADVNPPLGYLIIRAFQSVFGSSELVTRMPEGLGFFLMSICLYRFVARNSSAVFGYVAALLPWCSGAYYLANEARPYGLMLGFAGVALVCWQEAAERERARTWFLIGFTASLSAAALSHCYAVLIFIPFGIAEIVRQFERRHFDGKMWAALIAPTACTGFYFPLLASMKPYVYDNYFFKVSWTAIPEVYGFYLGPVLWPLAIGALLMTVPAFTAKSAPFDDVGAGAPPRSVRWHEWAVAGGFTILPCVAVVLAKSMGSQFFPRYAATGVLGFGLLLALSLRWRGTPERTTGWVATGFLVGYCVAFGQWLYPIMNVTPSAEKASLEKMERRQSPFDIRPELPFVAANGIHFFEIDHYGASSVTARLYYLVDRDSALEYTQADIFDSGFPVIMRWFPMHGKLAPYKEFVRQHPKFLVYGSYLFPNDWLLKKLIDDGATVSLITDKPSTIGDCMLFEVTPRQTQQPTSGN